MSETQITQIKNTDYAEKSNIATIGDEDLVEGLNIFGFAIFLVKQEDRLKDMFREILEKGYLALLIQEKYFLKIKDLYLKIKDRPYPLVLPFSDHRGPQGEAKEILREASLKAVGQDIIR